MEEVSSLKSKHRLLELILHLLSWLDATYYGLTTFEKSVLESISQCYFLSNEWFPWQDTVARRRSRLFKLIKLIAYCARCFPTVFLTVCFMTLGYSSASGAFVFLVYFTDRFHKNPNNLTIPFVVLFYWADISLWFILDITLLDEPAYCTFLVLTSRKKSTVIYAFSFDSFQLSKRRFS